MADNIGFYRRLEKSYSRMGKVYKRKRRSCGLCKPHKMGWDKKRTDKERELCKAHEAEMKEER